MDSIGLENATQDSNNSRTRAPDAFKCPILPNSKSQMNLVRKGMAVFGIPAMSRLTPFASEETFDFSKFTRP